MPPLVEGPCNDDGCRESGLHSLTLDGSFFDVKSAGPVSQGSEIMMKAGDGSNTSSFLADKDLEVSCIHFISIFTINFLSIQRS